MLGNSTKHKFPNYTEILEYCYKFSYYLGCSPYYFERKDGHKFKIRKHWMQTVSIKLKIKTNNGLITNAFYNYFL